MEKHKLLPVKSDIVFRLFFADERNREELICLLKAMLRLPDDDYDKIDIADPYLLPEYDDDKLAIIDVKLYTKSKKIIHIEIQLKITPEMNKRVIFYDSKLITEQIGEGEDYEAIHNVISIIITDKRLIAKSPCYHHRFTFYDPEAGVEFTDLVAIHTLELNKLPKEADGTDLYDWAKFIAAKNEEELAMVAERNPQVEKAAIKLRKLSADEQARDLYERREKARRDIASQTKFAVLAGERRGEKRGEKRGLHKGKLDVARMLLGMADPIDKIMQATGLTREEIEALRHTA